ncbi:MAG: YdeI/OmpD-associated family protein [Chloroflexi bacterium]|nr:YdeI/OmpD-associated family protein [Chloroflexota bacterium]MBI3177864.1 YdeI/OmpD-associated family protein [Chloroflexota bacterium]MBI4314993.1 YdeI/OmpD-associated family protein [Chloroflexota bacterium]MBI5291977.1 YdeI/OmpD-associated family protein [Chloroflexota bacterium]
MEYIDEARRPETRTRRIAKTVETLARKSSSQST